MILPSRALAWVAPLLGATAAALAQHPVDPVDAVDADPVDLAARELPEIASEVVWDRRAAEHLLSRAGFGASEAEVARAVRRGREAVVAELLDVDPFHERPFYARRRDSRSLDAYLRGLPPDERREEARRMRMEDEQQLRDFSAWWVERMVGGEDPLRERMTLFWHGYFTSSQQDVRNSHEMIRQNQLLRANALGSFAHLLHAIARDPAMLEYLDNATNRRGSPNENFARELMELFALGEGNYTEEDVKEAARAFTGWTDRDGRFRFLPGQHDGGQKTVLGVTGELDGDQVIDLLLAQEACARHLAGELLAWLEGLAPAPERLAEYAALLLREDYEIRPFLERLFADPAFYRDEVVGTRIASPVDFLVGAARRLGCDPPPQLILAGAAVLGQELFHPPNVQGWEEGAAWITTSALMLRGNLAGVLLGEVQARDFVEDDSFDLLVAEEDPPGGEGEVPGSMERSGRPAGSIPRRLGELGKLRALERSGWRPRLCLSAELDQAGARRDAEIVAALLERLLAVPAAPGTEQELAGVLARERTELGIEEGALLEDARRAEPVLRRLAHLVLCLPEAQLH